jgi:ABC-type oligopeptide transport system substrate-binding subunit
MKRKVLAMFLVSAMTLGLAGCGSTAVTGTESTSAAASAAAPAAATSAAAAESSAAAASSGAKASAGGDLNVMLETPVESLDPQQATDGTSFEVIADYTDGLMQMDADGKAVNALADSYEVSDDGLTYTFHLKDAKWSNGDPVTAGDFVFGWQRAVDPDVASEYAYMLSDIGQIKNAADIISFDETKAADYWTKGLSELGITSLKLDMLVDADDAPQKIAQVLKEEWEKTLPGLTVNLVVEPKKQRVQDMQDGNFQLGLTRWGPDYADPMTYLGMWVTNNSNNYGLWSDKDYDAIIAECTTGDLATDAQGRWTKLYDAEKIVMDDAVIFPLYTQCNAEMVSPSVTGIEYHPVALNRVYKDAVKQ